MRVAEKNNVLYLSYDGMTDPLGQSQVLPYLCGLSDSGYRITLISFEKAGIFEAGNDVIRAITGRHNIRWIPLRYHKTPPVISTLRDVMQLQKTIAKLHKERPFDLVHCRGYITALAGMQMKKKWGVKFLFDMRGFFADERAEIGLWDRKNPLYNAIYKYFKRKEKQFLKEADHVISLTHKGKKIMQELPFITAPFSCTVIPCCADLDHFNRENTEPRITLNTIQNIDKDNTIHFPKLVYLGSLGTWYMISEMLELFRTILERHPSASFSFITKDDPAGLLRIAHEKGIPREQLYIRPAERRELPSVLAAFDAAVFFILPVFSKQASSPTKQGELMGMGIPVICNAGVGDVDGIIRGYDSGYILESFEAADYRAAAEALEATLSKDRGLIRKGAEEVYSLSAGTEKYAAIYRSLLA